MLQVGLTGGIATGKTTVSGIFENAGAKVVDADQIAREVVAPGRPAWWAIKDLFGTGVLAPNGSLDREALAEVVFNDPDLRRQLETIVHPHVRDGISKKVSQLALATPAAVVVLDIPLLLETDMTQGLAEVIVVYASPQIQLQRLMRRDGLSRQQAQLRINAQMPIDEKRRRATIVIDNSGNIENTRNQTLALYRDFSSRAQSI
jgi:dephospho-CoA kinase